MAYNEISYPEDKESFYSVLSEQLKLHTGSAPSSMSALANAVSVLGTAFRDINWVGFYIVEGEKLLLGPFQGKPAVMEIPFGKGVCGRAWKEKTPIIVQDINTFPGHIACDCNSRSELVVPLLNPQGSVLGVLDIDSTVLGRFSSKDAGMLLEICNVIIPFIEQMNIH